MAEASNGYCPRMSSVKSRVAFAGGKYLVKHPRSRVTRLVVRLAVRRVAKKLVAATHADAIPAARGSRVTTVVGIAAVAGGIVLVVRKTAKPAAPESAVTVPPPYAPFPPAADAGPEAAGAPAETRDAPPTSPTTSPAAEAAAAEVGGDDEALVARVEAKLFSGAPALGVTVESQAGVVTLRGRVADEEAEGRFVRDAETIEGVKAVQSELEVAGAEPGSPAP